MMLLRCNVNRTSSAISPLSSVPRSVPGVPNFTVRSTCVASRVTILRIEFSILASRRQLTRAPSQQPSQRLLLPSSRWTQSRWHPCRGPRSSRKTAWRSVGAEKKPHKLGTIRIAVRAQQRTSHSTAVHACSNARGHVHSDLPVP